MNTSGKLTVVGAGFIGATTAMRLAQFDIVEQVVLTDIADGKAEGVALDINQSRPIEGFATEVVGVTTGPDGSGYEAIAGSRVVVVTAGLPRKPGMSRADLIEVNSGVVASVSEQIARHAPEAVVVVVSNPLDEMTALARSVTGFPPSRVIQDIDEIVTRTRNGGAEIVALLKTGSAYFAPSAAAAQMARAVVQDSGAVLPVCAWLDGEYGISGVYLGVQAELGRGGVRRIIETPLTAGELDALREAAADLAARC